MTRTDLPSSIHAEEHEAGTEASAIVLPQPPDVDEVLPDLDAGNLVEEAEQLLRESAPHDFDVLVIGSGPGGLAAALRAAELGAHVGIVEERQLGGTSINRGCLPAKILIEAGQVLQQLRQARLFGLSVEGSARADMAALQKLKRQAIERLQNDINETLQARNVELVPGQAKFAGKHTVRITTETGSYRANAVHIIIASGSVPETSDIPGAHLAGVINTNQLLDLQSVPASLVTIGASAIGLEMAGLFHALGARTTVVAESAALTSAEDDELNFTAAELVSAAGLDLRLGCEIQSITEGQDDMTVQFSAVDGAGGATAESVKAEMVLLAQARRANTAELDLERAGIAHVGGKIIVDEACQTTVAGVYAIGDCIHGAGSSHLAAAEGVLVAEHLMRQPFTVDLRHIPYCQYGDPEIAWVGLTETQAAALHYRVRSGKAYFKDNQRSMSQIRENGWAKIVADSETRKLLGCQIIGNGATELINHVVLALEAGLTVDEFSKSVFAHPSLGEVLVNAALAARGAAPNNDIFTEQN